MLKDRVKTFSAGLAEGIPGAFEVLDRKVAELGEIEIKSITNETFDEPLGHSATEIHRRMIVRTIVYTKE